MKDSDVIRLKDVVGAFKRMSDRGRIEEISIESKWTDIYGKTKHVQGIAAVSSLRNSSNPSPKNSFMFTASVGDDEEGALFAAQGFKTIQRYNGKFTPIKYYISGHELPKIGGHPGGLQISTRAHRNSNANLF